MINNALHSLILSSPTQTIKAGVELYNGSALEQVCSCEDVLSEFTVERAGEGKFFGFGVCHKLITNLIDIDRNLNITTNHRLKTIFGVQSDAEINYICPFPTFYVTEPPTRDETSNLLTVVAYDVLYKAANYTVADLGLAAPYTLRQVAEACAMILGISSLKLSDPESFELEFEEGANFSGTENLRAVLDDIAEVTQTIYFINYLGELVFIRLDKEGAPSLNITKSQYIELSSKGVQVLSRLAHATELGDNFAKPEEDIEGVTQFVRNNPFWEARSDVAELVESAQAAVGGTSISQFDCSWSGSYLLEVGDKIALTAEDDSSIISYVLDDAIIFDGTLLQSLRWEYKENDTETFTNPTDIGEIVNQTFAKVDKVNQEITLQAARVDTNEANISSLKLTTDNINANVKSVETITQEQQEQIEGINENIETLTKQVNLAVTDEDVQIAIQSELSNANGVSIKETNFTFNNQGLTIEKPEESDIKTQITQDGMSVYKREEEVLTANHQGVKAVDLHATTYLKIGNNSRLEDYEQYGEQRTACFWIGN